MATQTKKTLNAIGIHNPHDIARRGVRPRLIIDYYPQDLGRGGNAAKWKVSDIDGKTDPDAPWYENGDKAFYPRGPLTKAAKDASLATAIEWALQKYGIKEWEKSPFGSYHPKGTLAAALNGEQGETK